MAAGTSNEVHEFNELGWVRWPSRLGRISPGLAAVAADGDYLSAWPTIGAWAAPAALICGLLLGVSHFGAVPRDGLFYLYSLPALTLLIMLGQHGAGIGLLGWLSYVFGDLIHSYLSPDHGGKLLSVLAAAGLSASVLYLLVVATPQVTRALSRRITPPVAGTRQRLVRDAAVHASLQLVFVYLWLQVAPLLLQAAWIWRGVGPETDTFIASARASGWGLALLAAYAGAMRVLFETSAQASPLLQARRARRRAAGPPPRPDLGAAVVGAAVQAAVLTLMLSGLVDTALMAAPLFAVLLASAMVRGVVFGHFGLGEPIRRISLGLRLLLFLIAVFATSFLVTELTWETPGFMPVLAVVVGSIILGGFLLPPDAPKRHASTQMSNQGASG